MQKAHTQLNSNQMEQNTLLTILRIAVVLNVGCIFGGAVWAHENDIFTLSSSYSFFWLITILSFFASCSSYLLLETKSNKSKLSFLISGIVTFLWLCIAASVASVCRDCIYLKSHAGSYNPPTTVQVDYSTNTCSGEIIATTFGFASLIVWGLFCYLIGKNVLSSKPSFVV
jgi:hypothetical protein